MLIILWLNSEKQKKNAQKDSIWKLWEQLLTFGGMIIDVIFLPMFIYVFYFYVEFVLLCDF